MYSVYKNWCNENQRLHCGRDKFIKIIADNNIAIHQPKKDQCDVCIEHSLGTVSEETYFARIDRKDSGRAKKNQWKANTDADTLVITMHLQSVLTCPKTEANSMYYKMKLQLHNFTIYELRSQNVEMYVWDECNGGVTSNEFTTCIIDFIIKRVTNYKKFILISDGCNYQNRNRVLASSLRDIAFLHGIEIRQIILEKGHTMMEVDSVHSTLEHYFTLPIYAPSDYVSRMRMAKPKQPYQINVITYEFFLDYEKSASLTSLRPGKKIGDPTVVNIRQLLYKPNGEIQYEFNYDDDFEYFPIRRSTKNNTEITRNIPQLYKSKIPISLTKFNHLQDLKRVIASDHHKFYDSLPHT